MGWEIAWWAKKMRGPNSYSISGNNEYWKHRFCIHSFMRVLIWKTWTFKFQVFECLELSSKKSESIDKLLQASLDLKGMKLLSATKYAKCTFRTLYLVWFFFSPGDPYFVPISLFSPEKYHIDEQYSYTMICIHASGNLYNGEGR